MAKGTTEDEMAGWHHGLDGREFEWTLGDGDGQGGLVCCDSWGHKELDTTGRLNWTERGKMIFSKEHHKDFTMSVCLKQKINLAMWVILSTILRSKNPYTGVSLRRRHLNLQSFICSHSWRQTLFCEWDFSRSRENYLMKQKTYQTIKVQGKTTNRGL